MESPEIALRVDEISVLECKRHFSVVELEDAEQLLPPPHRGQPPLAPGVKGCLQGCSPCSPRSLPSTPLRPLPHSYFLLIGRASVVEENNDMRLEAFGFF